MKWDMQAQLKICQEDKFVLMKRKKGAPKFCFAFFIENILEENPIWPLTFGLQGWIVEKNAKKLGPLE